jgi:hypothetical protein
MDCPCPKCNGIDKEFHGFWGYDATYKNPVEREEEEELSLYDRLCKVTDELEKYGAPPNFINDLNSIIEDIDSLDDEVNSLKADYDVVELGEISKKLY